MESHNPRASKRRRGRRKVHSLIDKVFSRRKLERAWEKVKKNPGSAGSEEVTIEEFEERKDWYLDRLQHKLREGTYRPKPVRRVEIPKSDASVRKLGISTVLDRFIQQALLQAVNPIYDPTLSPHSYGFRPRRNAHQAVRRAKQYIEDGYEWVVDVDLEQCFDRINHDILMGRIAKRISDKRILRLIRRYLQAGIMVHGVVQERYEGTPQGGPLSPLLKNILLDELDKELERRGHAFCRYADDGNIYVSSERADKRVMESVERFLFKRLRLTVNRRKSAVARAHVRKFLGYSFTSGKELKIKLLNKALKGVKYRIRKITRRSRGIFLLQVIKELSGNLQGWLGYFRLIETPTVLKALDSWIRRRLYSFVMKQWIRNCHTRYKGLQVLGVNDWNARPVAASHKGFWAIANMKAVKVAMPNRFFAERGLLSLFNQYESLLRLYEPPCTDPYARWCGRAKVVRPSPILILLSTQIF